jgi:hypothetical protein
MSLADCFSFFCKSSKEKMQKFGTPWLTDNEVSMVGRQLGLQKFTDRSGNELSEAQAVCESLLSIILINTTLSQTTILVQAWRPMAFWAACSRDDDRVQQKVKQVNTGCTPEKEVVRAATIKEYGNLNVEDFQQFNFWLVDEEKVTYKGVVTKLAQLRHHRWAYWHIMAPDNPNVDPSCRMPSLYWHFLRPVPGFVSFLVVESHELGFGAHPLSDIAKRRLGVTQFGPMWGSCTSPPSQGRRRVYRT